MFSIHAFTASTTPNSILGNIAAAADPAIAVGGNFLYVPQLNQLLGAYAVGANLLRAQLSSPSLSTIVPFDITPIDANALPSSPLPILSDFSNPLPLTVNDPLELLVTNTGYQQETAIVFLGDGVQAPTTGAILHARATVTTPSTAYAWTNAALTFTDQLAAGTYSVVGMRFEDSHSVAARLVFVGGNSSTRPGVIAVGGTSKFDAQHLFRDGNLGTWGSFDSRTPPSIDILNDGTTQTGVVILDLIKTA